jgi:hypothetical protein
MSQVEPNGLHARLHQILEQDVWQVLTFLCLAFPANELVRLAALHLGFVKVRSFSREGESVLEFALSISESILGAVQALPLFFL